MLHSLCDLEAAFEAVRKWGLATGMRENMAKREGLALGKFRNRVLGRGIAWVKEGEHAVALGVPIGNELDSEQWWKKKILSVPLSFHLLYLFSERPLAAASYFGDPNLVM